MNLQPFFRCSGAALVALLVFSLGAVAQADDWRSALQKEIERIDESFPGDLGVYVRHLGTGVKVAHNTEQDWYLASTTKLPLAIVLMQKAENQGLDLEQKLTLRDADYVDGTGDLLWVDPGARYSLEELNRRSIVDSDSTATDMLIRFVGEDSLNEEVKRLVPEGLGPITTILQVRYDAYSEVHPSVSVLTNRDFIELKTANTYRARYDMLLEKLDISASEANAGSVREAFERYYQRGINSGSLKAYGVLMEQLARGELLDEAHTEQLLGYLSEITTGDHRIAGGLPAGTPFAHKTGTQVARSCDIGLLTPQVPDEAVIIAVCARDYAALSEAEKAYQAIGRALHESGLTGMTD
ncbi:MAG: serine hydrolase [Marinobacter sp.]|uniref:serine hydrolase n=1 Tax=Marinobacter sp. TaxID=50741 RepID=UPI0032981199